MENKTRYYKKEYSDGDTNLFKIENGKSYIYNEGEWEEKPRLLVRLDYEYDFDIIDETEAKKLMNK